MHQMPPPSLPGQKDSLLDEEPGLALADALKVRGQSGLHAAFQRFAAARSERWLFTNPTLLRSSSWVLACCGGCDDNCIR